MDLWIEKQKCTGCASCANRCPQKAIQLIADEDGFQYPIIHESKCVHCDVCKKVCPIYASETCGNSNVEEQRSKTPKAYSALSKKEEIRFFSTSGGFFTELATHVISQGGWVCGAAYDENNMVHHIIIEKEDDIEKVRQSKYVQSEIGNIYQIIEELLQQKKKVLFCGAPCQVAGLYQFLRCGADDLITMEFICLGVNSPKAYRYWLRELEEKRHQKVKRVWFKYKEDGWKKSPLCTRIDFADDSHVVLKGSRNTYMQGYLSGNLYLRPSCSACEFKQFPRRADFTVGDFWGVQNDDDRGTSVIFLNSENAVHIFDEMKDRLIYQECDIQQIIKGNPRLVSSPKYNQNGHDFLQEIETIPFSKVIHKYIQKENTFLKCLRKAKKYLKK